MENELAECIKCGYDVSDLEDSALCPKCGYKGKKKSVRVSIDVAAKMLVGYQIKNKQKRKKKPIFEHTHKFDIYRDKGIQVELIRTIDWENDHYFEKVFDPKTNEIIHLCEEPLSDHWGHGSAKNKPSANKALGENSEPLRDSESSS